MLAAKSVDLQSPGIERLASLQIWSLLATKKTRWRWTKGLTATSIIHTVYSNTTKPKCIHSSGKIRLAEAVTDYQHMLNLRPNVGKK